MAAVKLAYDVHEPQATSHENAAAPIILIHGLFWNKLMFRELAESLCQATERKVYNLDLRNHGESPSSDQCDLDLMVEDVKLFLDEHRIERAASVCHSLSSTITYLIALEKPDMFEKMVMIDHPPFAAFSESFFVQNVLLQFKSQDRFLKTLDPKLTLSEAKRKILSLAPYGTKAQEYFLKKVAHDLDKVSNNFRWKTDHQFLCDAYSNQAFSPSSRGSYGGDILIIRCSDSTRVNDEQYKAVLQYNPRAQLVTFEDTTHLLMFEKQEEFVNEVMKYLS